MNRIRRIFHQDDVTLVATALRNAFSTNDIEVTKITTRVCFKAAAPHLKALASSTHFTVQTSSGHAASLDDTSVYTRKLSCSIVDRERHMQVGSVDSNGGSTINVCSSTILVALHVRCGTKWDIIVRPEDDLDVVVSRVRGMIETSPAL